MWLKSKEKSLKIGVVLFLLLFAAACSQSPSLQSEGVPSSAQTVSELAPANGVRPPDMPTLPVDSGPQVEWECLKYLRNIDQYKPEEIPEDCQPYILPNARDAIHQPVKTLERIIPTIDKPADDSSPRIEIPRVNDIEEQLRRALEIPAANIEQIP